MGGAIKFGTDGWRGIIAEDFTFDNVRVCAQAAADHVAGGGGAARGLVVGYDTRFASEDFATAATEVLAANGVKVLLCTRAAPTPVVSHAIVANGAAGGIIITASHNPAAYNGFKYKSEDGASAPTETIAEIERNVASVLAGRTVKRIALDRARQEGLVRPLDPDPAYWKQVQGITDIGRVRRSGLKLGIDTMYGAGAGYLREVLGGGTIEMTEIHAQRNPSFPGIQPEPIAHNLKELAALVRNNGLDVGIAQDGDADRVGIIDEDGVFLNQLQVFALLALYMLEVRGEKRPIVKTVTSSAMLNRLGEIYGVPVFETRVGFKYVAPVMLREGAAIGGEESGGYGFRGHIPERDSIVAALYFLDFMVKTGKTPGQLLQYLYGKVGPHYYDRHDYPTSPDKHRSIAEHIAQSTPREIGGTKVARVDTTDGFRFFLEDGSWLLIRFSGTEPLIRVYAEADSQEKIRNLLAGGRKILGL